MRTKLFLLLPVLAVALIAPLVSNHNVKHDNSPPSHEASAYTAPAAILAPVAIFEGTSYQINGGTVASIAPARAERFDIAAPVKLVYGPRPLQMRQCNELASASKHFNRLAFIGFS